jgi:Uma2 family endonuclease
MSIASPARVSPLDSELLRQWLAVPEHLTAEIVGGELVTMPRPAPRHALAQDELLIELRGKRTRGPGGWIILTEPAITFGAELFAPDLAGWRRERMPRLPEQARIDLAPDWVCEILSPSTQGTDRARKMPTYASFEVPHVWLVDPAARILEVYRLSDGRWLQLGVWHDGAKVRAEPFEDTEIGLASLWSEDP